MLSSFLNGIIRFALHNRMVVAAAAVVVLLVGAWQISRLPIDVFPNLNRPRVVILTEAHGLAPEEVEQLVTIPIETSINGASGVIDVRSSSGVGLSVIYVEFDWGTDIYNDRQIVAERLDVVGEQLPEEVNPQLAPVSSIMGQVIMLGILSETNEKTWLFDAIGTIQTDDRLPDWLVREFGQQGVSFSDETKIREEIADKKWLVGPSLENDWFAIIPKPDSDSQVEVHRRTSPMQMRSSADWVVRQQLLTIEGVSQVFVMGGERKQFQVLVDPNQLLKYGVSLHEVKKALMQSNENSTGGYLDDQGPNEFLVRALGRVQTVAQINDIVVGQRDGQTLTLRQVANVIEGPQTKRGDSSVYVKRDEGNFAGGPGIIMNVTKQPGADTREVTVAVEAMVRDLAGRLGDDVRFEPKLYQQKEFIDHAVENVIEALRDGGVLVVVILFLFLLNFRTTFITLTAIPLSVATTLIVFWLCDLSINTMTLGGLAVAIGELVDDAIVDVENVFRRLKENRGRENRKHPLLVVFQASTEIRNSVVFGTMIVILVFLPIFALDGLPGRLFAPMGIAYIVSILSSLLISLTLTPVLCYWLLGSQRGGGTPEKDGIFLRLLKGLVGGVIRLSLALALPILLGAGLLVAAAVLMLTGLERDLLPPFNEGTVQVNVLMPAGTSLKQSVAIARIAGDRIRETPEVKTLSRRTGRAELDEHAEGVNVTEFIAALDDSNGSKRSRGEIIKEIRENVEQVPGIVVSVEQPLAHLISHMISGVKAQVGVKLYGDDLTLLRSNANKIKNMMDTVDGVTSAQVEQQTEVDQLQIRVLGDRLKQYGLRRADVTEFVETAMSGHVVSEVVEGQRKFDLVIRLQEEFREDFDSLERLSIQLPGGGTTQLKNVAKLLKSTGPNQIRHENVRRLIVIQCNVSERGLVDVVEDIKAAVKPIEANLPEGYFLEYSGQFESQQRASRMIQGLFGVAIAGMFLVLYSMFRSVNLSLQVMVALPMAFIGSVLALRLTGQTLTIAAMVGFISLCGIATRNGILLINHYLHLVRFEGETWSREMIVRAGKERVAPVLMTALTSGIGLVPLALAAGETGKEILYPVATVIIGGLITSTALEFLVRPALFWLFGIGAARRALDNESSKVELVEEGRLPTQSQTLSPENP